MKKTFLSLLSTNLLLFSSTFTYACNTVKKQQDEIKKDSDTNSVMTKNYEIYNEQIKQENKPVQNCLQEKQVQSLSSEKQLETDQNFTNEEKDDLINQQSTASLDQFALLSQITWQFLKGAQVKNLIAQIEVNQIYQDLIAKINSPVELTILDNNIEKDYNDYLQTKQYIVSLNYVIQNSLYPTVKNFPFKCNVKVNQISQKQINEQIANTYCDLIALWNKNTLHLYLKEWTDNFDFYTVEKLIKDIKTNAKTNALIDNDQIIDDFAIYISYNNKILDSKDIIEDQLYNVEVEVKIGQDENQVIKWTSFNVDFKEEFICQEEKPSLNLNNDIKQQDEYEPDLDSNNLDDLLNFTNITLDKIIDLLYNKPYFKDFITDLIKDLPLLLLV